MSLRILFADDSVTAQNMGKKILTEAGYEVVAVSNGAAAVKKIAEQKPDIIILDVYMPGYSGLEVCEKVRGSMETLKTPVLLTVGKMEPYKPEDANRVKADGVIVKPFEASDLLAIVKKFEERISQTPVMAQQPVLVDRFQEEVAEPPLELPVELPMAPSAPKPTVEVPDHMATASAFSDLLAAEPAVSGNHFEPPREPLPVRSAIPDYELPVSWRERDDPADEPPAPAAERVLVQPAAEAEPEPIVSPPPPPPVPSRPHAETIVPPPLPVASRPHAEPVVPPQPPVASRPLQIPVYEERQPSRRAYEVVPTSQPPAGDIEIPRDPELEESAAEATRNTVAEAVEPGLVPIHQVEAPPASTDAMAAELAPVEEPFTPAGFQDIPADIVSHHPPPIAEVVPAPPPEAPPPARLSDADFEARVAAAMSAYSHAHEAPPAISQPAAPEFPASPAGFDQSRADVLDMAEEALQTGVEIRPQSAAAHIPSPATEPPTPPREYYPPVRGFPASEARPSRVAPAAAHEELPAAANEPLSASEPGPPVFEYHPPVHAASAESAPETAQAFPAAAQPEAEPMATAEPLSLSEPAVAEAVATSHEHEALAAGIAAKLPEVAAAATGADHHTISQAVHRVMERLKPELVEEILRELKSKKE